MAPSCAHIALQDTFLLTDALEQLAGRTWTSQPPHTIVEVGCGSGFVICSAALILQHLGLLPRQLLAVDHSRAALTATRTTLSNHKVGQFVELLQSDLCSGWHSNLRGHIDLLLFNPPYVPTPDAELAAAGTGVVSTWAGGHAGRRVIDRLLPQLVDLLSPQGQLLMITVSENDPQGIIEALTDCGLVGEVFCSRQADEETLSVLRVLRPAGAAASHCMQAESHT